MKTHWQILRGNFRHSSAGRTFHALAVLTLLSTLNSQLSTLRAQGTAFTYQGRLNSSGTPANGIYDLRFTIYDSASVGVLIAGPLTNPATVLSSGLFTVTLDFGAGAFTGPNRWLEIAARSNGVGAFTILTPRQPLHSSPYAIYAGGASATGLTGTIPGGNLAGRYSNPLTLDNGANTFSGSGNGLFNINPGGILWAGCPPWSICGNAGTTAGVNFLGTTDNQPLELKVNSSRALRIEPNASAPNWIAGGSGSLMVGGGPGNNINGGNNHQINNGFYSTIGGGLGNTNEGSRSVIGGGQGNMMNGDSFAQTIGGGYQNRFSVSAYYSTIGGGKQNLIGLSSVSCTIAGGETNFLSSESSGSTIGGGVANYVGDLCTYSTLAGGNRNLIRTHSLASTIGGGMTNFIYDRANYAVIAGGAANTVNTNSSFSTISGGFFNFAGGTNATIGGGVSNQTAIAFNDRCTIGGGANNTIFGTDVANNIGCTIGGGIRNFMGAGIDGPASFAVIGGGIGNTISQASSGSTIGGGESNFIDGWDSTIAGGFNNTMEFLTRYSAIGGGRGNFIANGTVYGTISGGFSNRITGGALYSVISGGLANNAGVEAATVSGGEGNFANDFGTVPGGENNSAGFRCFAAGRRAKANTVGSFVWADSQNTDFVSTFNDQFLVRAAGGVCIGRVAPGFLLASNIVNLEVGVITNGKLNGITFREFADSDFGMSFGYDGSLSGDDNRLVIYDIGGLPKFSFESGGNLGLGVLNPVNAIDHSSGAHLTAGGAWVNASSRTLKENFRPVDSRSALEKINALKIQEWNYKADGKDTRHVGPVAEEFYEAFHLGDSDRCIATVDADGVALAAIQGLSRQLEEKEAEIQKLQERLARLEQRFASDR